MATIVARQVFTQPTQIGQANAPANVAGKKYQVQLDLDPADLVDPTKWVSLRVEKRLTVNDPWQDVGGVVYQGGVFFKRDGVTPADPPGFRIDGADIVGYQIRMNISPGHGTVGGVIQYAPGDTINTGVTGVVL